MRDDIGETENIFRVKTATATDKLLELLQAEREPKPKPEPMPCEALPPIPNEAIQRANDLIQSFDSVFSRVAAIQRAVLIFYPGITLADLKAPTRVPKVMRPRMLAMYLSKMLTDNSWSKIGNHFGGRDHSTVISAVEKIATLAKTDIELAAQIAAITEAAGGAIA